MKKHGMRAALGVALLGTIACGGIATESVGQGDEALQSVPGGVSTPTSGGSGGSVSLSGGICPQNDEQVRGALVIPNDGRCPSYVLGAGYETLKGTWSSVWLAENAGLDMSPAWQPAATAALIASGKPFCAYTLQGGYSPYFGLSAYDFAYMFTNSAETVPFCDIGGSGGGANTCASCNKPLPPPW